jgi:ABC-type bacteriocin/lantibiotic exporter with double-glycine peptidase domain
LEVDSGAAKASGGARGFEKMLLLRRMLALPLLAALFCFMAAAQKPESAKAAEQAALWLDVPFLRQAEEGCGSASISMVMQYWAAHEAQIDPSVADPDRIQKLLFSRKAGGIFASAMEKYFRDAGFDTFALRGTWDDLREHLARGRPLIAGLRPRRNTPALHYVVIVGLDANSSAVLVNDPARGPLIRVERAEFAAEWSAVRNWVLLALPRARSQAPSSPVQ